MKHLAVSGAIAAVISASALLIPHKTTHEVTHVSASRHVWPTISSAARNALVSDLRGKITTKLIIVCGDGSCTELAQDLDDVFEDLKLDSTLDRPAFPLGYGIGITTDEAFKVQAQTISAALKARTGLEVPVIDGSLKDGYIVLAIGKRPR